MTRLVWDDPSQRSYETGLDRGVFYPSDGPGVVWNGLVSIDKQSVGGDISPLHYDGIKYLDAVKNRFYQAVLTAFFAPEKFWESVGDKSVIPGFILTRQSRSRFGFSYRTLIGGTKDYKIHLVYNAIASPQGVSYSTLVGSPSARTLSWQIDATPPISENFRPSAHFVIDSTEVDPIALGLIEDILYGSDSRSPHLPAFDELFDIVNVGESSIIIPDTISGLADIVPGDGDVYATSHDGVYRMLPDTRLFETLTDGLYGLEL